MSISNPMSVPPQRSRGGSILKQPSFEICTVPRSGPDAGRVHCKITLQEFVPWRSGPLLRVRWEKDCVPVSFRDGARVGHKRQPGKVHHRHVENILPAH